MNLNQRQSNVLALVQVCFENHCIFASQIGMKMIEFLHYHLDTLHPKRRRTASSKAWEVELEQEEHSLSLSQHSSPSQSDQEQASLKKSADSISTSHGFHLFKQIPSNYQSNNSPASKQKELGNMARRTQQDIQFLGQHQNQLNLETCLHVVPSGRQGAQYSAVGQKSSEGGPVQNLVSGGYPRISLNTFSIGTALIYTSTIYVCSCHRILPFTPLDWCGGPR